MGRERVETIAVSLVREYLSRKGLKQSLRTLDKEVPRTEESINNRIVLAKEMHIEKLMRKNKELVEPFRTMIEVLVSHMTERRTPSAESYSHRSGLDNNASPQLPVRRSSSVQDLIVGNDSKDIFRSEVNKKVPNSSGRKSRLGEDVSILHDRPASTDHRRHSIGKHQRLTSEPLGLHLSSDSPLSSSIASPHGELDPRSKGLQSKRMLSGSLTSTLERRNSRKGPREPKEPIDLSFMDQTVNNSPTKPKGSANQEMMNIENGKPDRLESLISKRMPDSPVSRDRHNRHQREKAKVGDMLFDDIEDDFDEDTKDISLGPRGGKQRKGLSVDSVPISLESAKELRHLLFGAANVCFPPEWNKQNLSFSDVPDLAYGIVQVKGGPCGVLAAVQAVFLRCLLFDQERKETKRRPSSPSSEQQRVNLARAVATILWRARGSECACVALSSPTSKFVGGGNYKNDGLTETLILSRFKEYAELSNFLIQNISQWQMENSYGCILLLYSAIFSRGIKRIKHDMDVMDGTLIGSHGYCTQELVNLLLTGKAVSNVFDGTMELDSGGHSSSILKGIEDRSEIGYLSLFEHYRSCEVGDNYKNPKFPIWVVCSESHFSVLFSTTSDPLNKSKRRFDLYYYDGLARQDEEIRLTVDFTKPWDYEDGKDDLIPPLELCIRTKWKGCSISWNGTEPIL